jgi:hypothetical protein
MAALPSAPSLGYSFTPVAGIPGAQLDTEFNRTNAAVGALIDYVQVALNADGTLKTGQVTYSHITAAARDQLKDEAATQAVNEMFNLAKEWAEKLDGPVDDGFYSAKFWALQTGAGTVVPLMSPVGLTLLQADDAAEGRTILDVPSNAALTSGLAGKSDTGHAHDSRYYTESEIDAMAFAISRITGLQSALDTRGLILLDQNTIPSPVGFIDIPLPAGYRAWKLLLEGFVPSSASGALNFRASFDGGATYKSGASDYIGHFMFGDPVTLTGGSGAIGTAVVLMSGQLTGSWPSFLDLDIQAPIGANAASLSWKGQCMVLNTTNTCRSHLGSAYVGAVAATPTHIRLLYGSGNIAAGRWQLYGWKS